MNAPLKAVHFEDAIATRVRAILGSAARAAALQPGHPRDFSAHDAGVASARGIVVDAHGKLYPFVSPIRSQALWLGQHLAGRSVAAWTPPRFTPIVKIHGFNVGRIPTAVEHCAPLFGDSA